MVNKRTDLELLGDYRTSIDNLDSALIAILAERFRLTEKIGRLKAAARFKPMDRGRETRQLQQFRKRARSHHLPVRVTLGIMGEIIKHAKARHEQLQAGG